MVVGKLGSIETLNRPEPLGIGDLEFVIGSWGCGLQFKDDLLFRLFAVPALRCGAAAIRQPVSKHHIFSFSSGLCILIRFNFLHLFVTF
jgi:hypothetical protein